MSNDIRSDADIIVIFGGAGDPTWRKLVPALYNLFLDRWLPDRFAIVGVDRKGMEPPVAFDADEIRNKKLDVLRAVRPIPRDDLRQYAVRGHYGAGWIEGQSVPAYRDETNDVVIR